MVEQCLQHLQHFQQSFEYLSKGQLSEIHLAIGFGLGYFTNSLFGFFKGHACCSKTKKAKKRGK
jgi:hypothetical protein